ncbi:FkbM family methyltransferase [Sulfitobacter mediterraneus]|uniref:FkbM family methyltransferase n=1 Tax=Sulfitobacter mediterraneus TaxID=83219 RepID=UPI00193A2E4D|nr:FkbM family methyltransferase [Sulfitobacter mediterraneus]MBM1555077.1 FkbM family methyltransferase [Sulfitobacter mediterraneus]MBM1567370.1 FkbM family methyltransferase [Sulfitobacter mediterraneus]MBM1571172.1 FkbM family methyltransferase [Sulfitobacter mediterraneus]MBM1574972.1 FkbM family methyltransferase [Sulfitobacter mediterraneus]MBM1578035.1 FkbM family methyltransferase [Sulfitobacter mediterraneus]
MNFLYRALFKHLMLSAVRSHQDAGRPALAGYAFDLITAKIHLDGRFAHRELSALERHVFPQLEPGGICLDVGANIGNHAVNFAGVFDHVHAFEPNEKALDLLRINARLRPNVTVHPVGLSDRSHVLEVIQPAFNLGGTGASATNGNPLDEKVALQLNALDEMQLPLDGKRITFMKIDVEGHEPEVIRGAAQTLSDHSPVLGIEVDRRSVQDGSSPALDAAQALGYTHMYAMRRGRAARFRAVDRPTARNYPLLLLSKSELNFD